MNEAEDVKNKTNKQTNKQTNKRKESFKIVTRGVK
jgi:hypothetical protein